jgi:AcrR family transcriptional regulator
MAKKRVRRNVNEARDLILEEALKIVAIEGWSGLSFQKIAKNCKISTSNIVYHFESRNSMLIALLERIALNNHSIVAAGVKIDDNAFQRLINHFNKNLEWGKSFPEEAQILIQIYLESSHDPEFSPAFLAMIERAQNRIREHILAGIREGLFKTAIDPVILSRLLHNMLVGAFIYVMGTRTTGLEVNKSSDWEFALKSLLGFQD